MVGERRAQRRGKPLAHHYLIAGLPGPRRSRRRSNPLLAGTKRGRGRCPRSGEQTASGVYVSVAVRLRRRRQRRAISSAAGALGNATAATVCQTPARAYPPPKRERAPNPMLGHADGGLSAAEAACISALQLRRRTRAWSLQACTCNGR